MIKQTAFLLLALLILGAGASAALIVTVVSPNGAAYLNGTTTVTVSLLVDTNASAQIDLNLGASATLGENDSNVLANYRLTDATNCPNYDGNAAKQFECSVPLDTTKFGDGNYFINAKAFNVFNQVDSNNDSSDFSVQFDNTGPGTIADDFDQDWNATNQVIHFKCTDTLAACVRITVSWDGNTNQTYAQDEISVPISKDGNTEVTYYSRDARGNEERPNKIYVPIDKTAPTVSNNLPLTDTNKARPVVSFDVNDSGSGVADGNLLVDGNLVNPTSSALLGTGYHKSWDFNYDLANGTTISVRLRTDDNVGNNTGDVNWSFTVDLEAPTSISINGPSITNDSTPTLTLGASDSISGMPSGKMILSCNGSIWSSEIDYTTSYSSFNITSGNGCDAADGSKTLYARFRDRAGNWNSTSATASITYDTSAPGVPTSLSATPGNGQVSLTWTGVSGASTYKVYVNDSYRATVSTNSYTVPSLSNGTGYTFKVSAVDAAGNEGDKSSEVNAKPVSGSSGSDTDIACSNDDSAPYLAWESPASNSTVGALVNDTAIVRLKVYAYDYECDLKFVKFTVDGKPIDTDTTGVNDRYTVDWNSEKVVDGNHVLKATAMSFNADDAENSITKTITIKTSNGVTSVYLEETADGNKTAAQLVIGSAEDSKGNADALVAELASFGALPGEVAGGLISSASVLLDDAKADFDDGEYADAKKKANDAKAKFVQAVGMLAVGDYGGASYYVFNEEHLDIMLKNLGFSQQLRDEAKQLLQGNDVNRSLSFKKVEDNGKTYYKAVITLVVKNISGEAIDVKVVEIIPKELAASASEIAGSGFVVLVDDPVLEWTVSLGAGEEKKIVYALKGELTAEEADDMVASGIINKFAAPPVLFKETTNVEAMFSPALAGLFGLGGAVEIVGVAIIIGAIVVFAVLYVAGRNRGSGNESSALDAAASRAGFGSGFFGRLGGKEEPSKPKWGYKGI